VTSGGARHLLQAARHGGVDGRGAVDRRDRAQRQAQPLHDQLGCGPRGGCRCLALAAARQHQAEQLQGTPRAGSLKGDARAGLPEARQHVC